MMELILFLFAFVVISGSLAAEKPRIGVLRFTNNTHAGWWHGAVGGELQDMLIAELASTKSSGLRLGLNRGFFSRNLGEKAKTLTGKRSGAASWKFPSIWNVLPSSGKTAVA